MTYSTEQEALWAGQFGDEYADRNKSEALLVANTALFSRILGATRGVRSVIEFGANIGMNLLALRRLLPNATLSAIEINSTAAERLRGLGGITVHHTSILDFEPGEPQDFVLIKGVLIHINPDALPSVYAKLYQSSSRYLCLAEYYNPSPIEVSYRGRSGYLFKRDFAGELLDKYPELRVVDYGFAWRRDPNFPQDDITWFLLEKASKIP